MLALDDDDLCAAVRSVNPDPALRSRYMLLDILRRNIQALAVVESVRAPLRFGYSVKTNPDLEILAMVCRAGLYAEVISPEELDLAMECGFENRTIYNGPFPAWRTGSIPGIVFSDSVEAFAENTRRIEGALIGVRYRPLHIDSRFGVGNDQLPALCEAIRESRRRTVGVSLHVRPEDFKGRSWRQIVANALEFSRILERKCNVRVTAFDVGGGKTPVEFDQAIASGDFAWLLRESLSALPFAHAVFAEPGQAVVTPGAFVCAPVLEIRREGGRTDVVVDAGYPDLPQITSFPHRVLAIVDGEPQLLQQGSDRILGCTCLEYDVIRDDVKLPHALDRLQAIVIADAGAYDTSMGFDFARGGNRAVDDRIGVTGG